MSLFMAILWSISLIINIVSASFGNKPNWAQVFIPLVCCVFYSFLIF